jgi:hypothetical protein
MNKRNNNNKGRPADWKVTLLPFNLPRMISIWELVNPQLREVTVYQPGKPIEETARELGLDPNAIIKLASNENPLGPSPKAMEAMRDALEKVTFIPTAADFASAMQWQPNWASLPRTSSLAMVQMKCSNFLATRFSIPATTSSRRNMRLSSTN